MQNAGIVYADGMKIIHAVDANGAILKGVDAIRKVYEAVGLGWVFAFTKLWLIKPIVDRLYILWAAYRTDLTRGENVNEIIRKRNTLLQHRNEREASNSCTVCKY